tara:strand:+ start:681 stop:1274 length:594 start_codon:yes stop_codon:yes gene_type:complete
MSFRKEKKIKLTRYEFDLLKNNLLAKNMQRLHKKRTINSLYYDNQNCDMFNDSEEGVLPRKKVRIRWYNNSFKANTEVKTSSIEGRYKTTNVSSFSSISTLPQSILDSDYGVLSPSLLVSYSREYFSFESMRLTFDSSIKYINYRLSKNVEFKDNECVMEIKVNSFTSDDYIQKIIPWPMTRFSKYCRGLLNSKNQI